MPSLVEGSRGRSFFVRTLLHLKRFTNRLSKVRSGGRAASDVRCGYAANLDSPIFHYVQGVGSQLNLDSAVDVTKSRNPVKVQK
jgi:hypothetical protein